MRISLIQLLTICSCAHAFTPSKVQSVRGHHQNGITLLDPNRPKGVFMADVSSEPVKPAVSLPTPAMMDEGIFKFNKILIASVYKVICFFYPVTGGKRDFARFYVLETVARVPYFAYLSVMHLR